MYCPWHLEHQCTTLYVVHYSFMKRIKKQTLHTLLGLTGSLFFYVGFMAFTNPHKLPLPLLVVPSLLLGVIVFFLVSLLQALFLNHQSRVTALSVSGYIVLLSLLASLQQLGWRDAILAGLLVWLFVFYFKHSKN